MKNKKLLVGILSASSMAIALPTIASCTKSNYNQPEVSTKTPKYREVGAKATRTYFLITQNNINSPEDTKVKLINLKVNGADASVVAGLIKYNNDSAGNILVIFNMALAQKQYSANTISFDLLLTNKTANTQYTLKDFEVTLTDTASSVTYNIESAKGVTFIKFPDTVGEDEDLEVEFCLEAGYRWNDNSSWDVLVNNSSIKQEMLALIDQGWNLVELSEEGDRCFLIVPQTLIPSNSEVEIVLSSVGKTYATSIRDAKQAKSPFFSWDTSKIGANMAQHGTDYSITITPNDYYYIDNLEITTDGAKLIKDTDYTYSNNILTIKGSVILGDIVINVTCLPQTFSASVGEKTSGLTLKLDTTQQAVATHNQDYVFNYELDTGSVLDKTSIQCAVGTSTVLTIDNGLKINETAKTISVPGGLITGNLVLTGSGKAETYSLDLKVTGLSVSGMIAAPTYHTQFSLPCKLDTGYLLDPADFTGANPNITVKSGNNVLSLADGDFTIDTTNPHITITANKVEGDIAITGEIKHYTTTIESATEGAFASLPDPIEYTPTTGFSFSATLAETYSTPSAVIKCGETTFTADTDYTITTYGDVVTVASTTEGLAKITAPLTITLDALPTEVEFDGDPQSILAVGDTSSAYSATATTASGTTAATIALTEEAPADVTFADNKLTAGITTGTAKLQAKYQGAYTNLNVEIVDPGLSISGDNEVQPGGSVQLSPAWVVTPAAAKTFSWSSDNDNITVDNNGLVTATGTAIVGDSATITLKAQYGSLTASTALVAQFTITVQNELTVSGNHQLDIATEGASLTLTANDEKVTWSTNSSLITLSDTSGPTTTVTVNDAPDGGVAVVTCTRNSTNASISFDIHLASYSKIVMSYAGSGALYASITAAEGTPTGKFVIPGYYYTSTGEVKPTIVDSEAFIQTSTTTKANVTELVLLEGVNQINRAAFKGSEITSLTIPSSMTMLDSESFSAASIGTPGKLETVTFADNSNLTVISSNAFYYQSSLNTIVLPQKLQTIGMYAFKGCSSLSQINIPSTVTSIGDEAFNGCDQLKTIYIDSSTIACATSDASYMLSHATTVYVKKDITELAEFADSVISKNWTKGEQVGDYITFTK